MSAHLVVLVTFGLGGIASSGGCAGRSPDEGSPADAGDAPQEEGDFVAEARRLFPRTIDMHQRIVSRSCAPNAGVCHNTSNYPDLSTTGALLQVVGAWCNLELPDPTRGYDPCEREGDVLLVEGVFASEIAWVEREAMSRWRFGLRDEAPQELVDDDVFFFSSGMDDAVLRPAPEWEVRVNAAAGSAEVTVTVEGVADDPFVETFIDEVLASLVGGDPNRNGVFGAELVTNGQARVVAPGDLARSYLWGRITGTVPGSRMPLANEDLTNAEYVAVACFVETLASTRAAGREASPEDAIDYDGCAFAREPVRYSVLAE